MPSIRKIFSFFRDRPILADLLSVVGMAAYMLVLWIVAHNQVSVLDEGLYLYKGWLFKELLIWIVRVPLHQANK